MTKQDTNTPAPTVQLQSSKKISKRLILLQQLRQLVEHRVEVHPLEQRPAHCLPRLGARPTVLLQRIADFHGLGHDPAHPGADLNAPIPAKASIRLGVLTSNPRLFHTSSYFCHEQRPPALKRP